MRLFTHARKNLVVLGVPCSVLCMTLAGCGPDDEELRLSTRSRMHQIAVTILSYAQDHNDTLPDMTNLESLQKDVQKYGYAETFIHPRSKRRFLPNRSLSKRRISAPVLKKALPRIVMIYEEPASPIGTRWVAFGDGVTKRLEDESKWRALKAASGIK